MDIRRVKIKENENATVLSNDLIRAVVQDYNGRLIEFSAMNIHGGWVNSNKLHRFPFSKDIVDSSVRHSFKDPLMDKLYGYQVKVADDSSLDNPEDGNIKDGISNFDELVNQSENIAADEKDAFLDAVFEKDRIKWVVQRYGSDETTGGVWVLSTNDINFKNNIWDVKRLDVVLPNQPVVYSALYVKNISGETVNLNVGFDNTIGAPFLEAGCVVNSSAKLWNKFKDIDTTKIFERTADTNKPFPLDKIPQKSGGTWDAKSMVGIFGTTDVLYAKNEIENNSHIWSSIINPAHQLIYLSFAPGKKIMEDIDIDLNYSTMVLDYGGRNQPPWSLYEGGPSNEFSIHLGSSNSYYGKGQGVAFKPEEVKRVLYARCLTTYDNTRMGNNFTSFESFNHNIVLKRTKSSIVIPSDPKFEIIKKFCNNLIKFD